MRSLHNVHDDYQILKKLTSSYQRVNTRTKRGPADLAYLPIKPEEPSKKVRVQKVLLICAKQQNPAAILATGFISDRAKNILWLFL